MKKRTTRSTLNSKRERDRINYNIKYDDFRKRECERKRRERKIKKFKDEQIRGHATIKDILLAHSKLENGELKAKIELLEQRVQQLAEEKRLLEMALDSEKGKEHCSFPVLPYHEETITRALGDAVRFRKLVNITKEEFQTIQDQILFEMHRRNSTGQLYSYRIEQRSAISIRAHVFITLFWLKHYPTDIVMSHYFKLDSRTITRILQKTLTCICETYRYLIKWPSDEEAEILKQKFGSFVHGPFQSVICVADGTEIRVARPSNNQQQRWVYSNKKKQHSLNVMVLCLLNGSHIFVSKPRIGAHDQSHWNELGLRDKFIGKSYGILGDGGFTFNRQRDIIQIRGFKPYKKTKNQDLTEDQKKFNKQLSELRVVVENSISQLKKWRILKGTYRHFSLASEDQIDVDQVVEACALLTQMHLVKSPLRRDSWRPKSHPLYGRMVIDDIVN